MENLFGIASLRFCYVARAPRLNCFLAASRSEEAPVLGQTLPDDVAMRVGVVHPRRSFRFSFFHVHC